MLCVRHCKVCSTFTRSVELYIQTLNRKTYSCASGQMISTGWLQKQSNGRNWDCETYHCLLVCLACELCDVYLRIYSFATFKNTEDYVYSI